MNNNNVLKSNLCWYMEMYSYWWPRLSHIIDISVIFSFLIFMVLFDQYSTFWKFSYIFSVSICLLSLLWSIITFGPTILQLLSGIPSVTDTSVSALWVTQTWLHANLFPSCRQAIAVNDFFQCFTCVKLYLLKTKWNIVSGSLFLPDV